MSLASRFTLLLLTTLLLSACARMPSRTDTTRWAGARQLVLVVTPDWDANQGQLRRYARTEAGWQPVGETAPVTIGRSGSAWGIGLHDAQSGPTKQEGDGRAPAGVFSIGSAFGYADAASARRTTALPYRTMTASDYCIDVSASPLYNRIVDAKTVGESAVAGSTEPMRRDIHANGDQRYKLGFVIEHNPEGRTGAGSCIFAHLWKAPGETTAGCTAMDEAVMRQLLEWLQPGQHPVFVLLPAAEYTRLQATWGLPALAGTR